MFLSPQNFSNPQSITSAPITPKDPDYFTPWKNTNESFHMVPSRSSKVITKANETLNHSRDAISGGYEPVLPVMLESSSAQTSISAFRGSPEQV
jgi:hypothetical protein